MRKHSDFRTLVNIVRVLGKDRQKHGGESREVEGIVVEVVVKPQGKIDHLGASGNHLGASAEAGQEMSDAAVVLLNGEGQILAGEELVLRNDAVVSFPVAGDEGFALDPDLAEESLEGFVVTATQYPGDGAAADGVIRPPNPKPLCFFSRKCHISSNVTITVPSGTEGSGRRCAASRTQVSTVTSLTRRSRAMPRKPMFPMAYSSSASAFISGGLPRGGVMVKLQPHASQR